MARDFAPGQERGKKARAQALAMKEGPSSSFGEIADALIQGEGGETRGGNTHYLKGKKTIR